MRFLFSLLIFQLSSFLGFAQSSIPKVLKKFNNETVPYIYSKDISNEDSYLFLDARELDEYNVSHLKNAIFVGYNKFESKKVSDLITKKDTPIIVYCSIGVRSERIGEQLQKMGYTNVKNLYGGIFEWKNLGKEVYDINRNTTEKVHAFSKVWSKYLNSGKPVY
ncbi:MAG: rhodanese-related sulfurtransferase [Flavobacterium sp.]|jgi:rhodanese-related sulfurtransferase